MRPAIDILLGLAGQSIHLDALEGRPSSVTSVEVFGWDASDNNPEDDAIAGAPEVEDAPDTTTDAAAGPSQSNPRLIPVTATTGAEAERSYLIVDPDGRKEWIEVLEVDAGASLTARNPLQNDYASGAAVVSTRMLATIGTAWCSSAANIRTDAGANPQYRVKWTYVVDGITRVTETYLNLVRYAGAHNVKPTDVEGFMPGWLARLPTDHRHDQGRRLIANAYDRVRVNLAGVNFDDSTLAEADIVDELVLHKVIERTEYWRFMEKPDADPARWEAAQREYAKVLQEQITLVANAPQRDQATGAAAPAEPKRLTVR